MMRKIILLLACLVPWFCYSQKQAPIQPVKKSETKAESLADTIVTVDPLNPGREYRLIHNSKGVLKEQGFMLNGKKDGVWREYLDANGVMSKLIEYKEGKLNGASVTFNATGNITSDETYLDDKKNGQRSTYANFGGRLKLLENYKGDVLNGVKKMFYDDGKIQEEGSYKNGQRNGLVRWYRQNGNPTMEYTYENGTLEGPAKVFDENGKLKQEGVYRVNNEEGEWKEYNDSLLVKKIIYRHGLILKEIPVKK
ncbi:MAG: toxin-antitoxin system YwqK family antitoxin [Bacteroidetes bacterium]|nr:toxin-antitoxin system YwqK family antitoxin [Bacteroidota bacterium]